jgi:hypothetical protein
MAINTYNENNTYSTGSFVTYSSNLFVSIADNNLGNTPGTSGDTAYWKLMTPTITTYSSSTTYSVNDFVIYLSKMFRSKVASNKGNTPNINGDTVYWKRYNESSLDSYKPASATVLGSVKIPRNSGLQINGDGQIRINTMGTRFLGYNPQTNSIDVTKVSSSGKNKHQLALCSHPGILTGSQIAKVNSLPSNLTISLSSKADSSITLTGSNGIKIDNTTSGDLSSNRTISVRTASVSNPGVVKTSNWTNQTGAVTTSVISEKGLSDAFKSVVTVYPNTRPTPSSDMGFAIYIKPAK